MSVPFFKMNCAFFMHVCMCLVLRGSLSPYGSPLRSQGQQGMNKPSPVYASVLLLRFSN